jgi:hypothetical protein
VKQLNGLKGKVLGGQTCGPCCWCYACNRPPWWKMLLTYMVVLSGLIMSWDVIWWRYLIKSRDGMMMIDKLSFHLICIQVHFAIFDNHVRFAPCITLHPEEFYES